MTWSEREPGPPEAAALFPVAFTPNGHPGGADGILRPRGRPFPLPVVRPGGLSRGLSRGHPTPDGQSLPRLALSAHRLAAPLRLERRVQDPAVSVLDADHLGLADQPPVLVVEDTAE